MALMLQHKASKSVAQPASKYYIGDKNPVINAFEEDYKLFIQFMKKRCAPGYKKKDEEPYARGPNTLFSLWNNYEARLPSTYYQRKVIEMGDFLVSLKEYNLAVWQCYGRYLDQFGDQHIEDIVDIKTVKEIFFPDGLETDNASLTFRALYGKSICNYQLVLMTDPKLQNTQSVGLCLKILAFLRLITQVVLPREPLCWLVYNGTIHIYSVSRHLMTLGHSAQVLEFLLWACMCMENSIPLMSVRYLQWRTTLYTAVCQCYFDCKAPQQAENFARRALSKVNDLSQLEKISSAQPSVEVEMVFRQATVKLGIMVYRRSVFDRKRPKGLLRPKTRSNVKDSQSPTEVRTVTLVASDGRLIWHKTTKQRLDDLVKKQGNIPWPRTPVEKLLSDMFEGSAAQFLAILETLADSTRRTLLTSPAAPDTEDYILDTFSELFFAGMEIISGGGGNRPRNPQSVNDINLSGVVLDRSLIDLAAAAEDGIHISAVVRFIKWAYNYEQWEVYEALVHPTVDFLKSQSNNRYTHELLSLEILQAMEPLNPNRKSKKSHSQVDETSQGEHPALPLPQAAGGGQGSVSMQDHWVHLAEVLQSCSKDLLAESVDLDMVVDATLFLWGRVKSVFQRVQTGASDSGKYLQRLDNPNKWVHILSVLHEVVYWCGIADVDPGLTAEVGIRLALVLESQATTEMKENAKARGVSAEERQSLEDEGAMSPYPKESPYRSVLGSEGRGTHMGRASGITLYAASILQQGPREQLLLAREILERALQGVSFARTAVALTDGKSIADVSWVKDLNFTAQQPNVDPAPSTAAAAAPSKDKEENPDGVHNTIMDLHLELLYMYHRVCLKLAGTLGSRERKGSSKGSIKSGGPGSRMSGSKMSKLNEFDSMAIDTVEELLDFCDKNLLSKALFSMQQALQATDKDTDPSQKQKQLLQDAMNYITKAQDQELKLYNNNAVEKTGPVRDGGVPPAPLLVCRTDSSMVFKPAPFNPPQKVAWYRLFARTSSGSNVKVRLNDYNLPGTGEEIPAYDCELCVSGLRVNQRYVFAVAAYTADGQLIGDSIGDTSRPMLASHPLPVLMTWAFLSQAAYQVGCYDIGLTASMVLWDHFVAPIPPPRSEIRGESAREDYKIVLRQLNPKTASVASPLLLRMFLSSIFINVDIAMRDGSIYCTKLCDSGPYYKGQTQRLANCERMLVAIELAGWLNETTMALQAVVQCYGLLAPLIHYKIPSIPVVQVLMQCVAVLQEIPSSMRQRRHQSVSDSLHHMIATITFHLAKVLRTWKQKSLTNHIIDVGKKMLVVEKEPEKGGKADGTNIDFIEDGEGGATGNVQPKKKRGKRAGQPALALEGIKNEELSALEAHMLRLSRLAHNADELTGSEDPNILHAFISTLPSRHAYREVVKFRRRARYLEFLVQVVQKALSEGLPDIAIEWCEETTMWLVRRNEQLSAVKAIITKGPEAATVAGDDPKKYAAAVLEFSKIANSRQVQGKQANSKPVPRRRKKNFQLLVHLRSNLRLSDSAREQQENKELLAFDKLEMLLPDFYRVNRKKQRLRRICNDEMPWRAQMNILQGLCHFGQFLGKVEKRNKLLGPSVGDIYRSSYLDNEWFTFETAGTLVVGWDGGASRTVTRQGDTHASQSDPVIQQLQQLDLYDVNPYITGQPSGIEAAALATVGEPVPILPAPPDDKESDTMKTYRSSETERSGGGLNVAPAQPTVDVSGFTMQATIESIKKTFDHLKKAVVLAHRGHHWALLQNACRNMWNCAHTAILYCFSGGHGSGLLTVDALRGVVWHPFFLAVDCLLDMMVHLQDEADKNKKKGSPSEVLTNTWVGTVADEKGGASLKFESHLDDVSCFDSRWIRRMVLRVLEMLYYEQKWEKLADVAMRFNVLTQERYSEVVSPLLVQAQRKLVSRIQAYGGEPPVQAHFKMAAESHGVDKVTASNYMDVQLRVAFDPTQMKPLDMGGRIDPEGHDVYGGESDAFRVASVPLDVDHSLDGFRHALEKSNYTARALQHSRKLLVLYLAAQQNAPASGPSRQSLHSRVGFSETDDNPQVPVPPDLRRSEFKAVTEVETAALPVSQLAVVVSSYDKTIEMLMARKQSGLAAQAMHELGNIQYHASNIKAAYKWWNDALDLILGTTDTLKTWRRLLSDQQAKDVSSQLLDRCGMWGCLLGAMLAAKIAQYVLTSDLGMRLEACFLSAFLFKALFRTTLPHPTADRDYALYEIGEGCEVQYLVPGVDLLSDRFRCDGRTLIATLRWVSEELSRAKHNLLVLPLLTLYQYITTFLCRDLQRAVDGRILKLRILTDLGLYSEAYTVLGRLLHGERLPQTADKNFRQVETKMLTQKFDTGKPLTEPSNLKMLEYLMEKRVSPSLAILYGPHLTCHLSLAQAHLMVALASTIQVIPERDSLRVSSPAQRPVSPVTVSSISKPAKSTVSKKEVKAPGQKIVVDDADDNSFHSIPLSEVTMRKFTNEANMLTVERIKGTLLDTADEVLKLMVEVLQEHYARSLSASELELVVLAKLEQAAILREYHLPLTGSKVVLSALSDIQSSPIFKETRKSISPRRPSSMKGSRMKLSSTLFHSQMDASCDAPTQYQYQNFQSRSRLDARLWLDCRLALVKCLMGQIRGMGVLPGASGAGEVGECRQYCMQGLMEAEACGDVEMQAEFLMQGALLDLQEGRSLDDVQHTLKELVSLLSGQQTLSPPASLLVILAKVQLTDLEALTAQSFQQKHGQPITGHLLQSYMETQGLLLHQIKLLGDSVSRHTIYPELSAPTAPLQNLYLPHLLYLAKIKLRIGHALARLATQAGEAKPKKNIPKEDPLKAWAVVAGVLGTALELCRVCVVREGAVTAEILLQLGKVQRQLHRRGGARDCPARTVGATLMEAITTSMAANQDLGLIRQAYVEMAMVYLASSQQPEPPMPPPEPPQEKGPSLSKPSSTKKKVRTPSSAKKSTLGTAAASKTPSKREEERLNFIKDRQSERQAAWFALRCATAIALAQRTQALLIGDPSLTSLTLTDKVKGQLTACIKQDLFGDLGGEGMAAITPPPATSFTSNQALEPVEEVVDADRQSQGGASDTAGVNKEPQDAKISLTWVHLLAYTAILQRMCNLDSLALGDSGIASPVNAGNLAANFDLGFVDHSGMDTGSNLEIVRTPFLSSHASLRLQAMMTFLTDNLPVFATSCLAISPPTSILQPLSSSSSSSSVPSKDGALVIPTVVYTENTYTLPIIAEPTGQAVQGRNAEKLLVGAKERELCLQWYQPCYDDIRVGAADGDKGKGVVLLYSVSQPTGKEGTKAKTGQLQAPVIGQTTVSLSQLTELHDKLAVVRQRAEISLTDQPKPPSTPVGSAQGTPGSPGTPGGGGSKPGSRKSKRTHRIAQLSAKVKKDEDLEALLKQCCLTIEQLLLGKEDFEPKPGYNIPFEVRLANIHCIEQLFDPSYGDWIKEGKILAWLLAFLEPEKTDEA
ncbi:cilia- and flagella-associated protein 54-like [Diadema antillarum]|uniref:cilia- and flagella-associated protein 54-like n=1 Tax=Diadema antillarum TaxID=105358 RepID=UPI003A840F75